MGASTAAHQVEGHNVHSDYWVMEKLEDSMFAEPSGSAVDHYRLYRGDIGLMAGLGLNSIASLLNGPESNQRKATSMKQP